MHVYMGKRRKRRIGEALAQGLGCPLVTDLTLRPGTVVLYGSVYLWALLTEARAAGRAWIYADNGYLRPGHWDGCFSVTRGAYQVTAAMPPDFGRWAALGLSIAPWRRTGGHVLVCPPTAVWAGLNGFDADAWLAGTLASLRAVTDRPLRVRQKPLPGEAGTLLSADLADCWALVTHSSKAAVEALLAGVPVFCTEPCAASPMGLAALDGIENPALPDGREAWAAGLAASQWTLEEIRAGLFRPALGL